MQKNVKKVVKCEVKSYSAGAVECWQMSKLCDHFPRDVIQQPYLPFTRTIYTHILLTCQLQVTSINKLHH